MIAIVNVSPDGAPKTGTNQYEVRINKRVITTFEHDRQPGGLAQCLRDAADAVEICREKNNEQVIGSFLSALINSEN